MSGKLAKFSQGLADLQQRWTKLARVAQASPQQSSSLLMEFLEEMGVALEELNVAEEELVTQNAELLRLNEALSQQMEDYRNLFEFAPDGYLETDVHGNILRANHPASGLFNLNPEQLQRLPIANLIRPEDRRRVRSKINKMPTLQRVQHWEVGCMRMPDQGFEAMMTVDMIRDYQGAAVTLRWLVRDVTEFNRRRLNSRR